MNTLEAPQIDGRRMALSILVALAVGFIVVLTLGRVAGFADLTDTLEGAEWEWLVLCAVGQLAVFAGYAGVFRSAVAFPHGPALAPGESVRVVIASFGLTQIVATGGAAGLAFTYWALRRIGLERAEALVRLIGLNTAVYLVFGLVGWTGGVFGILAPGVPLGMALPWVVLVPILLVAARWFTQPSRVERWQVGDDGPIRRALGIGVGAAAWVRRALVAVEGRLVLRWAVLYWAGDLLSLWAALQAFGAAPSLAGLLLAYSTGYLAQSIPIPFIATGGGDAATTLTLTAVGVPVEIALLGVVAHRVFAFWLPIVPGLVSAVHLVRRDHPGLPLLARPERRTERVVQPPQPRTPPAD